MNKRINRLESVRPLEGMILEAHFSYGQVVRLDMTDTANRLVAFAPLKKRTVFARAAIADWGHSVAWSEDASIAADRLMEMALEQSGRTDTLAFRHWQDRNGLSLAEAAKALGMTRRTISQYRTGSRPVPRVVLLACAGYEAQRAA